MEFKKTICCIGAGYVGGPTMTVIALKCPEYKVEVVDIDEAKIAKWNSDRLPIYEPGLEEIIRATRGKNLFFHTNMARAIKESEVIFVSVNTPTKQHGEGAGMAADLRYWESTARTIREHAEGHKIVVEKSTLPVRTADAMAKILCNLSDCKSFEIVSNPEFLAEGSAIKDLLEPDRVLIGARDTEKGRQAAFAIEEIYLHWVPKERILLSSVWSSELSKLVSNALLAQRISSINSITPLCEITGADIREVSRAAGMDSRIGGKFLNASVGFGGSCFKKDILNLVYIARSYGLEEVADYWEWVVRMNDYQKHRFVKTMIRAMFNTLANKRICLFGFAFKANTSDTRETPALYITQKLLEEDASVVITDPKALENARSDLKGLSGNIEFVEDPYEAAKGSDAIAVITEWELYRNLDYGRIYDTMQKPAFIFDGRNILDHKALHSIGFQVYPLGARPLLHW
ncbi:MAG: nucleotide sugar dehydrogenase [Desulfatiglandales bacterium]